MSCQHQHREWPANGPVMEFRLPELDSEPRILQWCERCGAIRMVIGTNTGQWSFPRGDAPTGPAFRREL